MAEENEMDELKERITRDIKAAVNAQREWREEVRRAYEFVAGHQYAEEDVMVAEELRRPLITFNRIGPVIDAVVGMEAGNRHETRFAPMERTDAMKSELLTEAVRWASQRTHEPQQTSSAFRDMIICGIGVTGARVDFEEDPEGKIVIERIDPISYYWDANASGRNLLDRRWDATVRLVEHEEIEEMFGEDALDGVSIDADVWRDFITTGKRIHNADPIAAYTQTTVEDDNALVPLVEYEYFEREPYYRVSMPTGEVEITYADFRAMKAMLDEQQIKYVRQTRRKYYRVFMAGSVILEKTEAPNSKQFSRTVMTGKRDEVIESYYGMVRAMIGTPETQGPQQMANKLYSEAVNSIATQGKGGLLAESDAFESVEQAEDQWASSDSIIWMRPGGLTKVTPKPMGEYPQGMDRLLEWAVRSVPEVTGVNWELLGLVNRDQPGIVEDSRRQAAITILAEFFDALKLYRETLGRLTAQLVIDYMAGEDENSAQFIRLMGQGSEQLVPLLRDQLLMKYDVLVDDAPSSASQKDKTWSVLVDLVPMAAQLGMPPPADWLEYAPIPQALAQAWLQSLQQAQQQQADPATQKLMEAEAAKAQSQAQLNTAKTQESVANAQKTIMETKLKPVELQLRTFTPTPSKPTRSTPNG